MGRRSRRRISHNSGDAGERWVFLCFQWWYMYVVSVPLCCTTVFGRWLHGPAFTYFSEFIFALANTKIRRNESLPQITAIVTFCDNVGIQINSKNMCLGYGQRSAQQQNMERMKGDKIGICSFWKTSPQADLEFEKYGWTLCLATENSRAELELVDDIMWFFS